MGQEKRDVTALWIGYVCPGAIMQLKAVAILFVAREHEGDCLRFGARPMLISRRNSSRIRLSVSRTPGPY